MHRFPKPGVGGSSPPGRVGESAFLMQGRPICFSPQAHSSDFNAKRAKTAPQTSCRWPGCRQSSHGQPSHPSVVSDSAGTLVRATGGQHDERQPSFCTIRGPRLRSYFVIPTGARLRPDRGDRFRVADEKADAMTIRTSSRSCCVCRLTVPIVIASAPGDPGHSLSAPICARVALGADISPWMDHH